MTCFLDEFLCVILVTFVKSGEGVSIGCYKVIFCLTNGWISESGGFLDCVDFYLFLLLSQLLQ